MLPASDDDVSFPRGGNAHLSHAFFFDSCGIMNNRAGKVQCLKVRLGPSEQASVRKKTVLGVQSEYSL